MEQMIPEPEIVENEFSDAQSAVADYINANLNT